jgi:NitT/TauT family transport system ATP-binding protein
VTPAISVRNLAKRFASYDAVSDISFQVLPGRFVSIVGPSGCGKSTLLNLIAGLAAPMAGEIEIFGEPLRGINQHAAYMFQQDALLPWKTVLDNI